VLRVAAITPTTKDRDGYNSRIAQIFDSQDYQNSVHLFDYGAGTVGEKRNRLCQSANADIIIHLDSDDIYAPDWISRSVEFLTSNKCSCTGLSKAYFKRGADWFLYKAQENILPYVCGATMCYYRKAWVSNPFKDIQCGEDLFFQSGCIVKAHDHIHGFTATIHGSNTSPYEQILRAKEFTQIMPPR